MSDCVFKRVLRESPGGWLRDCRFKRGLRESPGGVVEGLQI